MKIGPTGIWYTSNPLDHPTDLNLCKGISAVFSSKFLSATTSPILDLGAGLGGYGKCLKSLGMSTVSVDGNDHLLAYDPNAIICDLTSPVELPSSDLILLLEVGNHIPGELEAHLMLNIRRASKRYLITSWAVPGQGGPSQLNCKPVVDQRYFIRNFGFDFDRETTATLRSFCSLSWIANSLSVYQLP